MTKKIEKFSDLIGETLKSIKGGAGDESIHFELEDGRVFLLYHSQACCESVYVESVVGDLQELVGSPLVVADESTGDDPEGFNNSDEYRESYTWTFYRLMTANASAVIRFYGTSNGYYSEGVSFAEFKGAPK